MDENREPELVAPPSAAALYSRYEQMFPALSAAEIDRLRRFGQVQRYADGQTL